MKIINYFIALLFLTSCFNLNAQCSFEEQNGLIMIEAEDLDLPSDWHIKTAKGGYTGSGYISWEGGDNFNTPGKGIITTKIKINKTGTYKFSWYNAVGAGTDPTEFNDSWLKFPDADNFYGQKGTNTSNRVYPNGSGKNPTADGAGSGGWFKIYTGGNTNWQWRAQTSDFDPHDIYVVFNSPGVYTMQISGRSDLHAIDRISLSNGGSGATNTGTPKTTCGGSSPTCSSVTMPAGNDWNKNVGGGLSPAYWDNDRQALAIDAVQYKGVFAGASKTFSGVTGKYNITLNTLSELDGESSYRLKVNGVQVGTFMNPETTVDYSPASTTFSNVDVSNGDVIQVEFSSHTNGKIPEGDITAYSRGRWTSVVFNCSTGGPTIVGPPGYTYAVNENAVVSISGAPQDIAYGNNGSYVYLPNQSGNVTCSNAVFGSDPTPGVVKYCFTKPSVVTDGGNIGITPSGVKVDGELRRWHKITLTCDGPNTNEGAGTNPFMNYRFDATFTHSSGKTFVVPGYYSACDDPTGGCNSGNKWKVHFSPSLTGEWSYSLSFKSGTKVAINGGGSSAGFFDGKSGDFTLGESDKTGRDFRAANKGVLAYVGEHYLRFTGTGGNTPNGKYFVKAGADAPENMLAYNDFDATPNRANRRKTWAPHQQDYNAVEAAQYTWDGGKGTEMLGVVNYLSTKGVNAFSFLTLSLHGDDENVFPFLMKVNESTYNGYNDTQQWEQGVHHDRFDVSKLAQWERIFEYADRKGMFMHFKTLETENDNIMDNNDDNPDENFGDERKIYYRELIARFSHHLALNWNLTEESTLRDNTVRQTATYIKSLDPYNHHRVLHTYPWEKEKRYDPQLGNSSELTGASLQSDKDKVHTEVLNWVNKSASSGKKWVVCNDEQGSAQIGVDVDGKDDKLVREDVLWGTLMAGGAGVEYYYGYQTDPSDLTAQSHRSRDLKYSHCAHAIRFFEDYIIDYVADMKSADGVTGNTADYVYAKAGELYVVYRPNGGTTNISLPNGATWSVQWYNPRSGGGLTAANPITNSLVAPNTNDWVALITNDGGISSNQAPQVSFGNPLPGATFEEGDDLGVTVNATDSDGTVVNVKLYLNDVLVRQEGDLDYQWGTDNPTEDDPVLLNMAKGTYTLKAVAEDNEGKTSQSSITIEVLEKGLQTFSSVNDAYLQGAGESNFNTEDLRVESGNRVTYIMFDISGLKEGVLESAKLEMNVSTDDGSGLINVYQAGNSWSETSINGSNKPAKLSNASVGSLNKTYSLGGTYIFDVATADFSGDQITFVLEMTGGNDVSFASKESNAAQGPKLTLKVDEVVSVNSKESGFRYNVFPNPTSGKVTMTEVVEWKLATVLGEELLVGESNELDLSSFPSGFYFITIEGETHRILKK